MIRTSSNNSLGCQFPSFTNLTLQSKDDDSTSQESSTTSTKISNYVSGNSRYSQDNTPILFGEIESSEKRITAQPLTVENLEQNFASPHREKLTAKDRLGRRTAKDEDWNAALEEIRKIPNSSIRDRAYKAIAEIATSIAAEELRTNTSSVFYSPTTLKAYRFAGQILDPPLRKEVILYIDNNLPDDSNDITDEPIIAEMDDILKDLQAWDLAERMAQQENWEGAEAQLNTIHDSFWKDAAYSSLHDFKDWYLAKQAAQQERWDDAESHVQAISDPSRKDFALSYLMKIAANFAIEHAGNKGVYQKAVLRANGYLQEIADPTHLDDMGIFLRNMLATKTIAPLDK